MTILRFLIIRGGVTSEEPWLVKILAVVCVDSSTRRARWCCASSGSWISMWSSLRAVVSMDDESAQTENTAIYTEDSSFCR